jgi:hypothetical protein
MRESKKHTVFRKEHKGKKHLANIFRKEIIKLGEHFPERNKIKLGEHFPERNNKTWRTFSGKK